MYIAGYQISYTRPITTLLRHDGSEYPGGTVCNKVQIPAERSIPELYNVANNRRAFQEPGHRVGRMGGFILEAFNEDGVAMILSDIARAATHGLFTLEIPNLPYEGPGGRRHHILFFEAEFQLVTDARSGQRVQWHRATIGGPIDVVSTWSY